MVVLDRFRIFWALAILTILILLVAWWIKGRYDRRVLHDYKKIRREVL
jgi:hypothetical protein